MRLSLHPKELPKQKKWISKPLTPYAVTKLLNQLPADIFRKTNEPDSFGLRYFNVFCPSQNPDGAYGAVILLFLRSLLTGKPLCTNGEGRLTCDFTFTKNVAQTNNRAPILTAASRIPFTISPAMNGSQQPNVGALK